MPEFVVEGVTDQAMALAAAASLVAFMLGLLVALILRHRLRTTLGATIAGLESELDQARQAILEQSHTLEMGAQRFRHLTDQLADVQNRNAGLTSDVERWRRLTSDLEKRMAGLSAESDGHNRRVQHLEQDCEKQHHRSEVLSGQLYDARVALREYEVTLEEERRTTKEKLELLERNRDALKQEFENLANRIFEEKSERFTQQTRTSLDTLLNPFRDQILDFRKRVEDVYTSETRDRQALRSEIKSLQELNRQITEEAANLTRALKGDKKIQGNWGELILERVLERSGLRKGIEYETQGSYRDKDGQLLRPDVVVYLPDNRNLVVDSKVSLVAYQQWANEDDDGQKPAFLQAHTEAVRSHIRSLSDKDYSQLHGLRSPDFVFLFMPIEPAFVAAFQHDERLFTEAFERKIIVVTPTTLLATLRTIENIWRYERQSQNARLIADRAGAIYDKLRVFVESMEKMGAQLQTVQGTYDSAMNTLTHGRGNLISQANRFVELGVRVKKEISQSVLDQAEVETGEAESVPGPDSK